MRHSILFPFLALSFLQCYAQEDYRAQLSAKLDKIRQLTFYDNGVVVLDESVAYGSTFPRWEATDRFYQDDIVTFKRGLVYRALVDNNGKSPATSPNEWQLVKGPHPYLFLRDSAKTEDLRILLGSDDPYIRTYAFGALAYRKSENLFDLVVDNLKDTVVIEQMTSDHGSMVCPADVMLWYTIQDFNNEQKNVLRKLILTRYTHLTTLEQILIVHEPVPDSHQSVRTIVEKEICVSASLVALARYRSVEDIPLIRLTLANVDVYRRRNLFFNVVENFPHESFKKELVGYKAELKQKADVSGSQSYFDALSAYKDNESLKVLSEFVEQIDKDSPFKNRNLKVLYRSLKKYHIPMYDGLMRKIGKNVSSKVQLDVNDEFDPQNPWHF